MLMKWLGLGAVSVLVCMTAGASADETQDIGSWTLLTRTQDGKSPNPLCILKTVASDSSSTTMQITNGISLTEPTRHGNASMFFYVDSNTLPEESLDLSNVSYQIDGKERWNVDARWKKVDGKVAALTSVLASDVATVIGPLARGNELAVVFRATDGSEQKAAVSLAGSGRALAEYEKCLNKVTIQSN